MNDAVAIILFKVVGDILSDDSTSSLASTVLTDDEQSTAGIIFGIIGGFLLNVVTSLAIGTAAGIQYFYYSAYLYQNISKVEILSR